MHIQVFPNIQIWTFSEKASNVQMIFTKYYVLRATSLILGSCEYLDEYYSILTLFKTNSIAQILNYSKQTRHLSVCNSPVKVVSLQYVYVCRETTFSREIYTAAKTHLIGKRALYQYPD